MINSSTVPGIFLAGGNKDVTAQEGETYSVGFDVTPAALPGLRFSATWWNVKYIGAITAPQAAFAIGAPDLTSLLQLFPGGVPRRRLPRRQAACRRRAARAHLVFHLQLPAAQRVQSRRERHRCRCLVSLRIGLGNFNIGLALVAQAQDGAAVRPGGEEFSVLNTIGINTTFPSNKTAGRASLGWQRNTCGPMFS